MTCLDINCDIVVGMADGELHSWNQVELGGDWYNVDLTWDDAIPDMGEYVKHTYVNINDEALSASHEWERSSTMSAQMMRIIITIRYLLFMKM